MNLYQINEEIVKLIDFETGEITDFAALDALIMQKNEKIENVALYIKNLDSDMEALKREIENLTERMNQKKKRKESLSQYLTDFMAAEGMAKFETSKCKIGFRKTSSVKIDDEKAFLDYAKENELYDLYTENIKLSPAKKNIKEYLKDHELPYAVIEEKQSMSIK